MRVLFVCHRFPYPPKRGGKIRPFNIIKHLSESHEVTVASLARSHGEANAGKGIERYCNDYLMETITRRQAFLNMMRRIPLKTPYSMGYFFSPRLKARIERLLGERRYDLIMVHCSSVAQYVEDVRGIAKVLDFGDMDSQKWLIYGGVKRFPVNLIYQTEGVRLRRAESELAKKFDLCTCTTKREMETLRCYGTGVRTDWFPNGVDIEYFKPAGEDYIPDSICFIGRMDYFPNQHGMIKFCTEILPRIRKERPGVRVWIVGADPNRKIRNLGKIDGVTVTGSVADVRPYASRCAVNVVPLTIARGTQNKILESMALGVPTVCSNQAARGVNAEPGEHIMVADSDEEFAAHVVRLLRDKAERKRISEAGRECVMLHHSWDKSMEKMDGIIASVVRQGKETGR